MTSILKLFSLMVPVILAAKPNESSDPWPCNRDFSPQNVWKHGFFYSQSFYSESRQGQNLKEAIHNQLRERGHRGFQTGYCRKNKSWFILSYPSAISLESDLNFTTKDLSAFCRANRLDFAHDLHAKSTTFQPHHLSLPGVVALTCYPKDTQAPEEWFLKPTGSQIKNIPFIYSPNMSEFIQKARAHFNLPPLKFSGFQTHPKLGHSRTELKGLRESARSQGLEFIGENRVVAQDLTEASFLLWFSPRHRDLILDEKATTAYLNEQKQANGETLYAFILFRDL